MPEGDTIYRTASALRQWIGGRVIDDAQSRSRDCDISQVLGLAITTIESRGKHLLIWFGERDWCLQTHMRMTGSWHVYLAGAKWQKPRSQANIVLTSGDRVAVCFNAPVVRLLSGKEIVRDGGLNALGQDLLGDHDLDTDVLLRSIRALDVSTPVGDLLLDQHVAAGIGNIYRCETLFVHRLSPWTSIGSLGDDQIADLYVTAARLLERNANSNTSSRRRFDSNDGGCFVYGRMGLPCQVCETAISVCRFGRDARILYWCESCQSPLATESVRHREVAR